MNELYLHDWLTTVIQVTLILRNSFRLIPNYWKCSIEICLAKTKILLRLTVNGLFTLLYNIFNTYVSCVWKNNCFEDSPSLVSVFCLLCSRKVLFFCELFCRKFFYARFTYIVMMRILYFYFSFLRIADEVCIRV